MRVHILAALGIMVSSIACAVAACSGAGRASGFDDSSGDAGGDGAGGGFGFSVDAAAKPPCVGLACAVDSQCGAGNETTLAGTVYAPNGTLPLYNAVIYVPNFDVAPMPTGAVCDQCGSVASGSPITTTLSGSDGKFKLKNVPTGKNIPLVIQIGKWRRQVAIPEIKRCSVNNVTDVELLRLPKKRSEGDMPQIALTTGGCDGLGCMLKKVGIDNSEFGTMADANRAVHIFTGGNSSGAGWPAADILWKDANTMKKYDQLILSCECTENLQNKGSSGTQAFQAMSDYMAAGGRIFTTDFMYTWYKLSSDPQMRSVGAIPGGAPVQSGGYSVALDQSFPKGQALVEWLKAAGSSSPAQPSFDVVFANLSSIDKTKAQVWGNDPSKPTTPRIFTVNTPVGLPVDKQCGKGVHIDVHVNNSDQVGAGFPATGCASAMKDGEKMLAFFMFDLASCIQKDSDPPPLPPVK